MVSAGFRADAEAYNAGVLIARQSQAHICLDLNTNKLKVKVKVTLVQALRLCTGRTAHRGSRGIALPFHDHGSRRE